MPLRGPCGDRLTSGLWSVGEAGLLSRGPFRRPGKRESACLVPDRETLLEKNLDQPERAPLTQVHDSSSVNITSVDLRSSDIPAFLTVGTAGTGVGAFS